MKLGNYVVGLAAISVSQLASVALGLTAPLEGVKVTLITFLWFCCGMRTPR